MQAPVLCDTLPRSFHPLPLPRMKSTIKPGILLTCLVAVAAIGCGPESSAAAADAPAAAAHVVPLPRSMETRPGELRIAGAVGSSGVPRLTKIIPTPPVLKGLGQGIKREARSRSRLDSGQKRIAINAREDGG